MLLWLIPFHAWAYTTEACVDCHGKENLEALQTSVHGGELGCGDCHTGVVDETHEEIEGSGAVDCNGCHDKENRHGLSGDREDRPECHTCHGSHAILPSGNPASTVHREHLTTTCSPCHPVECGETGYLAWLPSLQIRSHKKQDFSRDYGKGNCIGCHQGRAAHGEKAVVDGQNCYVCHMDGGKTGTVRGKIHPETDLKDQPVVFFSGILYQGLILVLLLGLFRYISGRISGKTGKKGG